MSTGKRSKKRSNAKHPDSSNPAESVAVPTDEISSDQPLLVQWWKQYRLWRKKRHDRIIARRKEKGVVRDWIETIVSVLLIVFVVRVCAVEAFRIPTGSMERTLLIGDFLLVNKFTYGIRTPDWIGIPFTNVGFTIPYFRLPGFTEPEAGDVIVFRYPNNQRVNYIKRCVAVGGDTLQIVNKQLFVNGEAVELPPEGQFTATRMWPPGVQMADIYPRGAGNKDNYGPIVVPEGNYFMMGDNRDNSLDSRFWGFLPEELILGEAMIIYFSFDKRPRHFWNYIRWNRILRLIR